MTSETESDQDSDTLDIETRKCPTETWIVTYIDQDWNRHRDREKDRKRDFFNFVRSCSINPGSM